MTNTEIKEQLNQLSEPEFQVFSSKLLPGTDHVLGVRLPNLRNIAKKLSKSDWRSYLKHASDDSFEEIMLQGMVIGYADCGPTELFEWCQGFLPKIDNWSVCDSFCASLKPATEHREAWWEFLIAQLPNQEEYTLRFILVMFTMHFTDKKYIEQVLVMVDSIHHPNYYVKMAQAWAVSTCFIKYRQETMEYLVHSRLDNWTYNKALQKIRESLCVDQETKERVRQMKRGKKT